MYHFGDTVGLATGSNLLTWSFSGVLDPSATQPTIAAFRRDGGTGVVSLLPIRTHGGSLAFANPTVTSLVAPSGRPAVLLTLFAPTEGAAPGEAGELIYFRELDPGARVP